MTSAVPAPAATTFDWLALYSAVQDSAHIPATDAETPGRNPFVLRHMYVDVVDAYSRLQADTSPVAVVIYADVAYISGNSVLDLAGTALILVARRIEVDGKADVRLTIAGERNPLLAVYAAEFGGSLRASTPASEIEVGPIVSKGVIVKVANGIPTRTDVDHLQQPMTMAGSEFERSLVSTMQFASVLFDSNPGVARSMLSWVQAASTGSADLAHLAIQSASMLLMLGAAGGNTAFVPYLSSSLYQDLYSAFVAAAEGYSTEYDRLNDQNTAVEDRKAAAALLLQHYDDTAQFADVLIAQTQRNLSAAIAAVDAASTGIQHQSDSLALARVDFDSGLKEFKYDQTVQLAFQIIGTIVDFASAAASMAVGLDGFSPSAGTAAAKLLETSLKSTSTAYKAALNLQTAAASLNSTAKAADTFNSTQNPLTNADGLSDTSAWSKFQVEADAALAPAIKSGIRGAQAYQAQLDILAIYGRNLAENQLSAIRIAQQLVQLTLQKQVSGSQRDRLAAYAGQLSAVEQQNADMMQMFYDRYLDMKRFLFTAVQNYVWAYKYWALRESAVEPSLFKTVAGLREDLAQIQNDYSQALESFQPKPQTIQRLQWVLDDAAAIGSLRTSRSISFRIAVDDPVFAGLARVRANTIRVFPNNAKPLGHSPIHLVLTNSGHYEDRLSGTSYRFTTAPLQLVFEYQPGDTPNILVDGMAADDLKFAYFVPTPFAEWTVTLPEDFNQGLDLSGVDKLVVEFSGSAIAAG